MIHIIGVSRVLVSGFRLKRESLFRGLSCIFSLPALYCKELVRAGLPNNLQRDRTDAGEGHVLNVSAV